ncbi:MAG: enoyl-CoA hydratase [Bacteroidetes bacterium]|nr:MAG: enoyl-CoA hydratase [Bacteroidota bacterium]
MFSNLLVETQTETLVITINRPKVLNALNQQTLREIKDAMDMLQADDNLKGAIITGAGDKAFAAGADIAEFAHLEAEEAQAFSRFGQEVFFAIEHSAKPVIAAVNGFALGGGCELAMACHMRIAASSARFGQPEVKLGLLPGYGGTQRLAQLIGRGKAIELLITGDMIDADEALKWGLVNALTTRVELMDKCYELLGKAYRQSPMAIRLTLDALNAGYKNRNGYTAVNGYEIEAQHFGKAITSYDGREGTQAFLDKRKPAFKGK